jgi:hypothetical protein
VVRVPKIRAGRRTQEIVTWTIGVVVVLLLWLVGSLLVHHLGIG